MDKREFALKQHEEWAGKIEVISRAKIETPEDLSVAYTPGVAEPCKEISKDVDLSYKYTRSRTGRYRTGSRYAGYGRKMCIV